MADLLQSVPAEDYFRHKDLKPVVIESLRRDARPFLALVGAPGSWDVSKQPTLPLFGIYKTNDRDNADMPIVTHWQLVFTAPGREELAVLPWEENGKIPLADPVVATPPPPGTTPKTTYSYDQDWRDVAYSRLPPGPKEWKAILHAGKFLSNPISIRIIGAKTDEPKGNAPARSVRPISAYSVADQESYARHAGHPPAPESGVAFAEPVPGGSSESPSIMLWGAFNLPDPPPPNAAYMQIHLLFTAPDILGSINRTISIPMDFVEIHGNRVKGQFGLDLSQVFRGPSGKGKVPAHLHVTAVRGSFIGKPWESGR